MVLSPAIAEHFENPRNIGALPDADAMGTAGTPGAGPFLTIYLRVDGARIVEARFETYGCPVCRACGSLVTEIVAGRPFAAAKLLEPADVDRILGGLPLGKEHCPRMAVEALRNALGCCKDPAF